MVAAIGERAARRYFTTAEPFDAQRAAKLGLVSEVVDSDELDRQVEAMIDALLANGPEAVMAAKQLVRDLSGRPIDSALIAETCTAIADIRVSQQGRQGLAAFLEKRRPDWRGE